MEEQAVLRSAQVVAKKLDISPATLRRWSDEFSDFLTDDAAGTGERSQRRYHDSDLARLRVVRDLMNEGHTYEQVRRQLSKNGAMPLEPDGIVTDEPHHAAGEFDFAADFVAATGDGAGVEGDDDDDDDDELTGAALVAAGNGAESAVAFLTNTLATLSDSQKSILNSQAANRELLGVLLQDNFNLKEENNRLRERMLQVEREVSQSRQDEEWRREALRQELEAKITAVGQMANEAAKSAAAASSVEVPEIKTVETNAGCLGSLLGLKNQQVVVVPRRRKAEAAPGAPPSPPATAQPPAVNHPKPLFPPE
ncbi:MAG: hypothetical protein Kow0031_03880 [Anaerolineae bacterium]